MSIVRPEVYFTEERCLDFQKIKQVCNTGAVMASVIDYPLQCECRGKSAIITFALRGIMVAEVVDLATSDFFFGIQGPAQVTGVQMELLPYLFKHPMYERVFNTIEMIVRAKLQQAGALKKDEVMPESPFRERIIAMYARESIPHLYDPRERLAGELIRLRLIYNRVQGIPNNITRSTPFFSCVSEYFYSEEFHNQLMLLTGEALTYCFFANDLHPLKWAPYKWQLGAELSEYRKHKASYVSSALAENCGRKHEGIITEIVSTTMYPLYCFPGDGDGVGQRVCARLNKQALSCDLFPAGPGVERGEALPFIKHAPEGSLVILSYVFSMFTEREKRMLINYKGPMVVIDNELPIFLSTTARTNVAANIPLSLQSNRDTPVMQHLTRFPNYLDLLKYCVSGTARVLCLMLPENTRAFLDFLNFHMVRCVPFVLPSMVSMVQKMVSGTQTTVAKVWSEAHCRDFQVVTDCPYVAGSFYIGAGCETKQLRFVAGFKEVGTREVCVSPMHLRGRDLIRFEDSDLNYYSFREVEHMAVVWKAQSENTLRVRVERGYSSQKEFPHPMKMAEEIIRGIESYVKGGQMWSANVLTRFRPVTEG